MIDSKVCIGGVSEHFNYPWHLLLKSKELQASGINPKRKARLRIFLKFFTPQRNPLDKPCIFIA